MKKDRNEGEGNKTAARNYDEAATKHAKSGQVGDEAKRAREAVEGDEAGKLREAERAGKQRIAEEDPEVRGK
jgi:hypothetical protein